MGVGVWARAGVVINIGHMKKFEQLFNFQPLQAFFKVKTVLWAADYWYIVTCGLRWVTMEQRWKFPVRLLTFRTHQHGVQRPCLPQYHCEEKGGWTGQGIMGNRFGEL